MSSIKANQLKKDMFVLYKGQPCEVLKCEFYFPGKGSAFARTKLRNVRTGNAAEFTYKSNDLVELVEVEQIELQYLYQEGSVYYFMNPRSFEQFEVAEKVFGGRGKWLQPEAKMFFSLYEGEIIGCRFPLKVKVKVIEASEATAGNTVNAAKKPVKVESFGGAQDKGGVEVLAPLFVKEGDTLIISTDDGTYVSRG